MLRVQKTQNVSMRIEFFEGDPVIVCYSDVTNKQVLREARRIFKKGYLWQSESNPKLKELWAPSSIKRIMWEFDDE